MPLRKPRSVAGVKIGGSTMSRQPCRPPATKKGRVDCTAAQAVAAALLASAMANTVTASGPRPEALARQGGSGLLVAPDTFTALNRQLIAASAARHRIPAVYVFREAVVAGGLLSYGPQQLDVIRRSASYIDRIIRGERPAELPIQAPVKFELVINMKAAQALGLEIPPTLLARADEVIE